MKKWQKYLKSLAKPEHVVSIISESEMTFKMECTSNKGIDIKQIVVHVFNEGGVFWIEVDNTVYNNSEPMCFDRMLKCLEWAEVFSFDTYIYSKLRVNVSASTNLKLGLKNV